MEWSGKRGAARAVRRRGGACGGAAWAARLGAEIGLGYSAHGALKCVSLRDGSPPRSYNTRQWR